MDFINTYFIDVLKNQYADFNGFAGRRQYWYYVAIMFAISVALSFVGGFFAFISDIFVLLFNCVIAIFNLALLVPSAAIVVRRLRDAGYHPLFILLAFVPLVNIALLVLLLMPTKVEGNEFRK